MRIDPAWEKLSGELGFFVPCLDTAKVREIGLRSSVRTGKWVYATPGIRKGMLGVWFSFAPPPSSASGRTRSRSA
jgi:hypothetical protein